jgi:hypothetical protein
MVSQSLPRARKEYELLLFSALFDFHRMMSLVEQMRKMVKKAVSFNEETLPFLESLAPVFSEWQSVADKFRPQLTKLLLSNEPSILKQRLTAACKYFVPMQEKLAQQIAAHPCRSKNKADASDFEPLMNDLFLGLHEKIHLMRSLLKTDSPSSESLLQARNTFVAPMSELQPIMEKPAKKTKKPKESNARKLTTPRRPAKNEIKPDDMNDLAVEAMIHDMLEAGKPSPYLLDFIKMMRQKRTPVESSDGTNHAGKPWKVEDDLLLRELFFKGTSVSQLAQEFSRTTGAIRSRLKKLGLVE